MNAFCFDLDGTVTREEIKAQEIIYRIKLQKKLVDFIKGNPDNCFIVTGNLDVWVSKLMERLGCGL